MVEVASSPCSAAETDWGFGSGLDLVVFVLAGGDGKRMGGAKPECTLGGRRLIDHAIDMARRHGEQVAIGLRTADQISAVDDFECVIDQPGIEGPVSSLAAGIAWAKQRGARCLLTIPCDAPFLPHDLIGRLQMRLKTSSAAVAIPVSHGRRHPSIALWRTSVLDQFPLYFASGRRSLIGLAEHVGYAVEDWGAPERDPFLNVNTPEDLQTAETWLAQPHLE